MSTTANRGKYADFSGCFHRRSGDITYLHLYVDGPLAREKTFNKLAPNDNEKGKIAVKPAQRCALEIRDEFEECGHSFALVIELLTAELHLSNRARLALIEYGNVQMDRFEKAEAKLRDYVEDTTPN